MEMLLAFAFILMGLTNYRINKLEHRIDALEKEK